MMIFRRPIWSVVLITSLCGLAKSDPTPTADGPFLMFSARSRVLMGLGNYSPQKGWLPFNDLDDTPQPGDVFTLYGMSGEIAQVTNTNSFPPSNRRSPVEWSASITPWYRGTDELYALAVQGRSPFKVEPARKLPLDNPDIRTQVSSFLKKRGLDVPEPRVTQAYELTLAAGEPPSMLVAVHSDSGTVTNKQPASIYSLTLVLRAKEGTWTIEPITVQTSYKPAWQSIDDHQRYHGKQDYCRLIASLDIDGDGQKEIVMFKTEQEVATVVKIFSFRKNRWRKVISAYKQLFIN